MSKNRMEAFSDGVIAILITIMVLELKVPNGTDLASVFPMLPVILSYILSFILLGIYWSNHHHLLQATEHIDGRVLWANMHLLFWLSLVPFVTGWMGENRFASMPVAFYGAVQFFAGIAYYILSRTLISLHGRESLLAKAVGRDYKGRVSIVIYFTAILLAPWYPLLSCLLYVLVAIMWLIPDPRIEKKIVEEEEK